MAASDTSTATAAPENGAKQIKHDHKAFERQVEEVSDDLVALRKHLTIALDSLFRNDQEPVNLDDIRKAIANIQEDEKLDRYNASAKNYNAAMDVNSDFLIQLRGTNRSSKYFGNYIDGFPERPADIENLTNKDAVKILDALSIEHTHETDPDLRFTNDPKWDPFKQGHGHKAHHHPHANGMAKQDEEWLVKARSKRLKRQVRVAYGLLPFHITPVTINTIDSRDV